MWCTTLLHHLTRVCLLLIVCAMLAACGAVPTATTTTASQAAEAAPDDWQANFQLDQRTLSPTGESTYFILRPGFQTTLESSSEKVVTTVLDETRDFNGITTRVVEEREEKNGAVIEISRNFFAIDQNTGDVFYFGEEVDDYNQGTIISHSGAWLAYENGNQPGLIMPGKPEVGMKYYQEVAPGVAMDRAEIVALSETYTTTAGEFKDCVITKESSKLKPNAIEHKTYAPGIGLIQDQAMTLTAYGYVDQPTAYHKEMYKR